MEMAARLLAGGSARVKHRGALRGSDRGVLEFPERRRGGGRDVLPAADRVRRCVSRCAEAAVRGVVRVLQPEQFHGGSIEIETLAKTGDPRAKLFGERGECVQGGS